MDFSNFFPSLLPSDLEQHIGKYLPKKFDAEDIQVVSRLCFWRPRKQKNLRLSIGAPSSPFISNTLMYEFDRKTFEFSREYGTTYTRYADDLTFSTNTENVLRDIHQLVLDNVAKLPYPRVSINTEKTVHTSKKHHRRVTGLVLSSQGVVSLGRDKKREISAMVHRAIRGHLNNESRMRLKGLLAFAYDVEPSFIARLKEKYDDGFVENLLRRSD